MMEEGFVNPAVRLGVAGLVSLVVAACDAPWPHEAAFIETLGSDTVAVETLRWNSERFEGTVVVRSPETRLLDYWGIRQDGRILEYGFQWRSPVADPETPPLLSGTAVWFGDSVDVTLRDEDGVRLERLWAPSTTVPIPGRIPPPPLLAYAPVGAWRQIVQRLSTSDDPLHILVLGRRPAPRTITRPAVRWADDSVGIRVISEWTVARLDASHELASISGHATTIAVDVSPATTPIEIATLAREYAAREEQGEGFGLPSPSASVEAEVEGARLVVTYGRPARRGRRIWGGLVPYGEVWRTGANLATHMETDRDVILGGVLVPAGRYTLWTHVDADGVELIVNRETEIWGTQYDASQDLARIPMTRASLIDPVERFTIEIGAREGAAGDGGDGVLAMSWDHTRFSVPINVPSTRIP